jgi:opacity protein-like surface antigen
MKKLIWITVLIFLGIYDISAQVAYGLTMKTELYTRYANPSDGIASRSAGSALANFGLGPKLWFGGKNFAISPEAAAVISPFALSTGVFKGIGAVSFPLMVKFQFGGLSSFADNKFGFALGGGIQYSRTELFGVTNEFEDLGVERNYFRTYIIEADFGFGASGFTIHGLVRYGFDPDTDANTISVGIGYDFNIPRLKERANSEF